MISGSFSSFDIDRRATSLTSMVDASGVARWPSDLH
jgi:hypothetical protein